MAYETIIVETRGKVGLITLNRPKALKALNSQVLADVVAAGERRVSCERPPVRLERIRSRRDRRHHLCSDGVAAGRSKRAGNSFL